MGKLIWFHQVVSLLIFIFFHFQVISSSSFLSSSSPTSSQQLCPQDQSSALLQFKNTFSIDKSRSNFYCDNTAGIISYPKTESWKEGTVCCSWDGVTCSRLTGQVIDLDLSCSWLYGNFPSNSSLPLLRHLKRLNLAYNDFSVSPISSEFGGFVSLTHLNLSSSGFSGQVLSEISHLSKLTLLDLSHNGLQLDRESFETLTQNITQLRNLVLEFVNMSSIKLFPLLMNFSSLRSLSLRYSQLGGMFSEDVFRFPYLEELSLSENFFLTGNIPKSNWTSPIKLLDLSSTNFSGELSDSVGNSKSLKYIPLSKCSFKGSIPASLGNLEQLTHLDLAFNSFKGSIPASLWNLEQLTHLDLSGNSFKGSIPASLWNLEQLTHLDLSINSFEGLIPDVFGKLSKLTFLNFQYNNLTGQSPQSPFNLTKLSQIHFGYNQLTGSLPHFLCGLSNLTHFSLWYNQLNGSIPFCLFTLPSLQWLHLSYNRFTDQIPEFHSIPLRYIYLENNNLRGQIPRSIMQLSNLSNLFLSSNNLSGTIELDLFSKLKSLARLDLSYNSLSVITNSSYSAWPKLYELRLSSCNISEFPGFLRTQNMLSVLYLSNNNIHGELPTWFWDMGKESLGNIDLSHNFLTSMVPFPIQMTSLYYVDLGSNLLQGQIPSLICNFSYLLVLDLSNNSLSGAIPTCLGNLSESLQVLNLGMNNFHGIIPTTFAKGNKLRSLDLNGNQLEGSLPRSLVNCIYLEVLNLGNNKISDTFPHWLESLPELRILVLRSNRFNSIVSNSKTRFPFPKLRIIDLSYNQFTGLLPGKYFEKLTGIMNVNESKVKLKYMGIYYIPFYYKDSVIVTMKGSDIELLSINSIFTTIDMSNNRFEGEIPRSVGKLNSLRVLNFSHNCLVGHIPTSLGNLSVLESLDLSSNQLIEEIPMQLTDLTFLSILNLFQNHLIGPIPRDRQFGSFLNDSYSGNLGLCGTPLIRKCNNEAPQPVPSTFQQDDEFTIRFGWKITMMGYGCGLVLGLSMGYTVFSTGKPQWLVRMVERKQHQKVRIANQRQGGRKNPRRG